MKLQHQETMSVQSHETCQTCGGKLLHLGNLPPSRFPAIRVLGVIQERWECQTCNAEYTRNVQPAEKPALAS
jgi:hypothetical protein